MLKIGEGETSEVFRIEKGKVIKLFKEDFFDISEFEKEYTISKQIGDAFEFAPKVYEKCILNGRYGFVMDEVNGDLFQNIIDNNPSNIQYYAELFGNTNSLLHNLTSIDHLSEFGRYTDVIPCFLNSNGNFPAEVDSWLIGLVGTLSDELSIIHSDFMPYNMIYTDEKLCIIDWAESMLGPASTGIARTINFIIDPTDYPYSEYTKSSNKFIKYYLDSYSKNRKIDYHELDKCFILNAACEYNWAVFSEKVDNFSELQKEYVLQNYQRYGSVTYYELIDKLSC